MPKHLYLPELAESANIKEPALSGHWETCERRIVLGIGDGILVDEQAETRGISSVPDVWARPLMFRSAIRPGSHHPLRRRVLQEWRGLLSLLALHRLHSYDVQVAPVALGDGPFETALRRLAPRPVRLEREQEYAWTDTLLVRYEGIPVGAFSPATLVYTATAYNRRLRDTPLNLADAEGYLAPPEPGSDDERHVALWLEQLQERLNEPRDEARRILHTGTDNPDRPVVSDLNALLTAWLGELRERHGLTRPQDRFEAPEVRLAEEPVQVAPAAPFVGRYRVYQQLLRPLVRTGEGGSRSELALRRGREGGPYREVVIITPRLLQSGARIWQGKRLSHLGGDVERAMQQFFAAPMGTEIDREDLKKHDAVWLRPELHFLTDTLVGVPDGGRFLAQTEQALNGEGRFVLPFRRELLDYFSPEEIRTVLRPTFRETEGGVVFGFTLPVGSREERVERTYRHRPGADGGNGAGGVLVTAPPTIELFPNYLDAHWRRYYLFQDGAERLTVEPVVRDGVQVTARVQGRAGSAERVRVVQTRGDGAFPEALVLRAGDGGAPLGLVLVERPEEPPGLSGAWRVGVDFGTSNTNVFRQRSEADNAERWQLHFPRHLRSITAAADPEQARRRKAVLEEFFVPDRVVELPVPTNLRIFQDAVREHPLLDYFIYFSPEFRLPRNVHSDIKWDVERERKTEYFLECLLLLILVEVVAERVETVQLACSYPKAFSDEGKVLFQGEWDRIVKRLLTGPDRVTTRRRTDDDPDPARGATADAPGGDAAADGFIAGKGKLEVPVPEFEVEGVAAGEFFASEKTIHDVRDRARKEIVAVALDVGGGTTDISIWYHNEIVLDASILLAGREIARLFQQNTRVMEVLFSNDAAAALEERKNEPGHFAARLNVVLRQEETQIREMLIKHANQRGVQWIRRMLAVEFGAIAFYTAALLGAADRARGGGVLEEVLGRGITLHWGGNAAKFINWIDFGKYDEGGIAAKMLNAMVFNALKDVGATADASTLGQRQSPGHKSEAAGGLVVMSGVGQRTRRGARAADDDLDVPLDGDASPQSSRRSAGVVAGDDIELVDRSVGHLDVISERVLYDRGRTTFKRTSLDRLSRFVGIVNAIGVRFGLLTDDSRIDLDRYRTTIGDAVRSHFVKAEGLREGHRVIEPVFVLEVKVLLDLLKSDLR